jgi:hypothetical protein
LSVIAAAGALTAAAQVSGSIQTTLPTGATVQGNIYPSKAQVFLTAGPQNQKASGLPDGRYYFQVTDPSGSALLSNDPAVCRQVVVSGGRLAGAYDPITQSLEPAGTPLDSAGCEHASIAITPTANSASGAAAVQVGGAVRACSIGTSGPDILCNTPNPGGAYKLWLIAQSSAVPACSTTVNPDGFTLTFDASCAKTDNFQTQLPAVSHVAACAFNDANGNGVLDPGELMMSGWPFTATVPAASYVILRSDTQSGTSITASTDSTGCVSFAALGIPANTQVTVTLTEANLSGWTQTAPVDGIYDASGKPAMSGATSVAGGMISVSLGPGATSTAPRFGNTDPQCPNCSVLGTVTVVNTATPNKLYTWGITKSVDKAEVDNVTPGGSATFNYTVSVTHDNGSGSLITGAISLINADGGNPFVMLNVTDVVSDGGVCNIKDPASGQYVPEVFNLTIDSFTETSLSYQCTYTGGSAPSAGTNTVTAANVSNPPVQYTGATHYDFSTASAIADGSVTVADTLKGALGTVISADASPKTFSYPYTFTGDPTGTCTSHNNTASFTGNTTAATASASQSVKVCVRNPAAIATTPNPTSVTLGASPVTLKDSAMLSGAVNPTGAITFTLLYQGQVVDTETLTVNGNGIYTTPAGYTLPATGTVAGTYQWNASYSGDATNSAVSESSNAAEQVSVSRATPGMDVTLSGEFGGDMRQLVEGSATTATANLSGGYNPTGTLTFTFSQDGAVLCTRTVTVTGNGTYSTPTGCLVPNTRENALSWRATYGGDSNNNSRFADTIDYSTSL